MKRAVRYVKIEIIPWEACWVGRANSGREGEGCSDDGDWNLKDQKGQNDIFHSKLMLRMFKIRFIILCPVLKIYLMHSFSVKKNLHN